ncbi:hypothetical protein KOR34_37080 [Posidoniimonas corsicana]|uniref:Uncharacterized protein n=1 Tax=Posidoniimonas corsicana TaxID=1938618 RepID=A0A5C5V7Z3_9BACT|nr:CsbD family protein [Posidoniimonas corsicana]TWT33872.1 hypothetical protein KOR34_37080 [Posidoniimonas corsicana]
MSWEVIERDWKFVCNQVLLTWGKLSEDDLVFIAGDRDRFVDLYVQRYGVDRERATARVDAFAENLALTSPAAALTTPC